MTAVLRQAESRAELAAARRLFEEYARSLDVDLEFQGFAAELDSLPGDYGPPGGCLLLAYHESAAVGCVALRPLEGKSCEMKRLYVQPGSRRLGLGRQLVDKVTEVARSAGYRRMRLDTLADMTAARALYRRAGFRETDAYRFNPLAGARFLELRL